MKKKQMFALQPGETVEHKDYGLATVLSIMPNFGAVIQPNTIDGRLMLHIHSGVLIDTPLLKDNPKLLTHTEQQPDPEPDIAKKVETFWQMVYDIQSGKFDSADKDLCDPAITGCGVGVLKIYDHLQQPEDMLAIYHIKRLISEGRMRSIDPDGQGLISFVAIKLTS